MFSRISLPALRFQFIADKTLGQQRLVGCPVDSSWGATGANVPYYHLSLHFGLVGPRQFEKIDGIKKKGIRSYYVDFGKMAKYHFLCLFPRIVLLPQRYI